MLRERKHAHTSFFQNQAMCMFYIFFVIMVSEALVYDFKVGMLNQFKNKLHEFS